MPPISIAPDYRDKPVAIRTYLSFLASTAATWIVLTPVLTTGAFGQSVTDGFDPNVNGSIAAMALQADGKVIIAGSFTAVQGTRHTNIARVNVDGSVDGTFRAGTDFEVFCVAMQRDGKIIVGGFFTTLAGQPRSRIGRLNLDGTIDGTFNPGADYPVESVVVQADGKIVVGGRFGILGGEDRGYIGRLQEDGSVDRLFNPAADGYVWSLLIQPDGKILVGGEFRMLGSRASSRLGRLNSDGSVDSTFNPGPCGTIFSLALQQDGRILLSSGCGPQQHTYLNRLNADGSFDDTFQADANDYVWDIKVQADGQILVGGRFTSLAGQRRCKIGRLHPNGALDVGFNPGKTNDACTIVSPTGGTINDVRRILVQSDGKLLVGGNFTNLLGRIRHGIGRLHADGSLETTFNPGASDGVTALVLQPDEKILVGGGFTNLAGESRKYIGRLNVDGTLDATFDPGADSNVTSLAVQTDGKVLVGGYFTNLFGQTRDRIARLNADGTLDTAFASGVNGAGPYVAVYSLALQTDGKILVGGKFTTLGGTTRTNIGRLNSDGSVDTTFNPGASFYPPEYGAVSSLALQSDGKILVAGFFTRLGGQSHTNIGRLNRDGTPDTNFNAWANSGVSCLDIQANGKILVGGNFYYLCGQPRNSFGRLFADGTLDKDFTPQIGPPYSFVNSMALQADGNILIVGSFTTLSGEARFHIGRLAADGALDTAFIPWADGNVYSVGVEADGKILVGGYFSFISGQERNNIGRVTNGAAALQTLAINTSGTTVTWSRSGAGPEVEQVTFDQSMNGGDYTPLGPATRISKGWELTGLSLPAGRNFYLRARGRPSGGQSNGSGGLIESVAQFYRIPPPYLIAPVGLRDGTLQFTFANPSVANFTVLAAAQVALPVSNWTVLGSATNRGDGVYQFIDSAATNLPGRFYQLRWP